MYFPSKIKEERQMHICHNNSLEKSLILVYNLFPKGNVEKVTLVLNCYLS